MFLVIFQMSQSLIDLWSKTKEVASGGAARSRYKIFFFSHLSLPTCAGAGIMHFSQFDAIANIASAYLPASFEYSWELISSCRIPNHNWHFWERGYDIFAPAFAVLSSVTIDGYLILTIWITTTSLQCWEALAISLNLCQFCMEHLTVLAVVGRTKIIYTNS